MAKYSNTKAKINEKITTNSAQAITGNVLNEVLQTMVDSLGADYQFGGLVQPGSTFTEGEQPVVFLATTPGTYTNFGGIVVADGEVALLVWSGTAWSKQTPDIATRTEVSQLGQEIKETYGDYVENSEWLKVVTDKDGRILYGVKTDGTFNFGAGCPPQVQEYVLLHKAEILLALNEKVDKENGKSLIDEFFASSQISVDNSEWLQVTTDYEGKIISGIKNDGTKVENTDTKYPNGIPNDIKEYVDDEIESIRQINSDWDELDTSSPAYIKNKPDIDNKQDKLISGINIKTINNLSLLGSGNINISSGGSTSESNFIDACNYGFSAENSASDNVSALQTVLDGGNKTVYITIPGIYLLNDTILLYDNTTLICQKGVIIKKATQYGNVLMNEGAAERRTNSNISIIGLTLDVNGMEVSLGLNSAIYGLKGHLSFLCTEGLMIQNFTCRNLESGMYGIQVNTFHNLLIENSVIEGKKDGIHLSDGDMFRISNCIINTKDDPIALNSSDWQSSNCVDGSISNGIIENIQTNNYDTKSGHFRLLVGAWVDWYSGMSIRRGDRVVNNGKVYRACTNVVEDVTYISSTEPTINTYSNSQADNGGFYWKLMKVREVYQTNINNIVYRDCTCGGNKNFFYCEVDKTSEWNRSLHPDVAIVNYPHIENIKVENCKMLGSDGSFISSPDINTMFVFDECIISTPMVFEQPVSSSLFSEYHLSNMDLRNMENRESIRCYSDTVVHINNCIGYNGIIIIGGNYSGRILSNVNIDKTPTGAVKGDYCIVNQIPKIFNGNTWVELI